MNYAEAPRERRSRACFSLDIEVGYAAGRGREGRLCLGGAWGAQPSRRPPRGPVPGAPPLGAPRPPSRGGSRREAASRRTRGARRGWGRAASRRRTALGAVAPSSGGGRHGRRNREERRAFSAFLIYWVSVLRRRMASRLYPTPPSLNVKRGLKAAAEAQGKTRKT